MDPCFLSVNVFASGSPLQSGQNSFLIWCNEGVLKGSVITCTAGDVGLPYQANLKLDAARDLNASYGTSYLVTCHLELQKPKIRKRLSSEPRKIPHTISIPLFSSMSSLKVSVLALYQLPAQYPPNTSVTDRPS